MSFTSKLKIIGIAALAVSTAGLSAFPAQATGDDHDRGRGHEERAPPRRVYHHAYGYDEPRIVYAPPTVYYAPPPRPPIIDFVIPLTIR